MAGGDDVPCPGPPLRPHHHPLDAAGQAVEEAGPGHRQGTMPVTRIHPVTVLPQQPHPGAETDPVQEIVRKTYIFPVHTRPPVRLIGPGPATPIPCPQWESQ